MKLIRIHLLVMTTLVAQLPASLRAESTFSSGDDHFAWSGNSGWIDFVRPQPAPGEGVKVGDTMLAGHAWSPNTGWIHFGDGTPANQIRYANADGTDFGVNHDGAGNLSGLAWSPNLGWIQFGWAAPGDPKRPRFDLMSGDFTGFAWSANTGWINLGSGLLRTDGIAITDSDHDGISDTWEFDRAGDLVTLGSGDGDDDGIGDLDEYLADTDPLDPADKLHIIHLGRDAASQSAELTWTSRPTRRYRVEKSTDLANWQPFPAWLPGATGDFTATAVPAAEARAFYRVEARLPLTSP